MANRNLFPASALDRTVAMLCGLVTFGGSGAVSTVDALGFTVTKPTGTGLYRITLEDRWTDLIGASLVMLCPAAADVKVQLQAVDLTTKVIDFQIIGGAVAADATSGHKVYITLHFRNTSTRRKG